jgi:phosphomannomutase
MLGVQSGYVAPLPKRWITKNIDMKNEHSERIDIDPKRDKWQKIEITDKLVDSYSLEEWANNFSLMTAGYRDQLDPNDRANPKVAFNTVTVAILGEAKARVLKRHIGKDRTIHLHIGGETRPHTQDFISILARVYAAHDIKVHLRARIRTTPIWYSSYGIFYNEFNGGENLTASHSQFFKGGWKPLDSEGKQLLEEEKEIICEVQNIVKKRSQIRLAPWLSSDKIFYDFDVDEPYVRYLESVVGSQPINEIKNAAKKGFRCSICTVGGSMKATSERLFHMLGITTGEDGVIQYFFGEEDSQYHKIGQIGGENFGVDPTKKEIYRSIGAKEILLSKKANLVFIWDPDGDRFNIVTTAPSSCLEQAKEFGLQVEPAENDVGIVYFSANQIFLMLTAYRIDALKADDLFEAYDWFISCSITTSHALSELAAQEKIPVLPVRVGFKHHGALAAWIEERIDEGEPYRTPTGEKVYLGKRPRALIMCEESGGGSFGSKDLLMNKTGTRGMIALREKDGMQTGLLTLALAASLHNSNQSFAEYYCNLIVKRSIKYKFFYRGDITLYDESLTGNKLQAAKKEGMAKRDRVMEYFKELAMDSIENNKSLMQIGDEINSRVTKHNVHLPYPKKICLIGEGLLDGILIEYDTFLFIIRASGTDAVLRYYVDGEDRRMIQAYQKSLIEMQI